MIHTVFTVGTLVNAGSGVLLALLGAWVLTVRPRRRENVAFGIFTIGWGVGHIAYNVMTTSPAVLAAGGVLAGVAGAVAGAALIRLALLLPAPVGRQEWASVVWAAVASLVADVPAMLYAFRFTQDTQLDAVLFVGWAVLRHAFWFTLVLLVLRYPRFRGHERLEAGAVLMTQALGLYLLLLPMWTLMEVARLSPAQAGTDWGFHLAFESLAALLVAGMIVLLWTRQLLTAPEPRRPRAALLTLLMVGLVGMVMSDVDWVAGGARTLSVLLLAYAILRHQLLDIDVRVKWTLKQSTVAAIFIAAFFIVSEGAAALFEAQTGSTVAGILAAGGLVFAIAPLQRLADRLAETAMPGVGDTPDHLERRKRDIYAAAVSSAMRDGVITDAERDVLATLADELGLSAGEARALERESVGPAKEAAP